jgi:hypothetical protein
MPIRTPPIVVGPSYLLGADLAAASAFRLQGKDKIHYDVWSDLDAREPWAPAR